MCITDVRFLNEVELVKSLSGRIAQVVRPTANGSLLSNTARHVSEAMAAQPHDDEGLVIHNDGDLDHLHAELVRVLSGLHTPDLANTKRAAWCVDESTS